MDKSSYFHRVSAQTATRFWINNVTREEADMAIEAGAVGCTQNPSYVWKMLSHETESAYATDILKDILKGTKDANEAQAALQRTLVGNVAKHFLPMYEETHGAWGYVSIQGNPFMETTEDIIRFAEYNREAGPNIMAKIPVTEDGLKAIEYCASKRIPINATEVMAVRQALDVCEVYEKATKGMKDPAPIYFSHITGIYDEYLQNYVKENHVDISPDTLWQAGIAAAKKVYQIVNDKRYPVGFIGGGARGLHHFTEMVGAKACITINWKGAAEDLLKQNPPVVQRFFMPVPTAVLDELYEKLPDFRRGYDVHGITPPEYEQFGPVVLFRSSFEDAWTKANAYIKEQIEQL